MVSQSLAKDPSIWRYMDLAKFVQMVSKRCLWFAKVMRFDDPYECFGTAVLPRWPADDVAPKWITQTDPNGATTQISIREMFARIGEMSADRFEQAPECLYVNSWCLSMESMAMWEIYGVRAGAVAIRSSIDRFKQSVNLEIPESQHICGTVQYHSEPALDLPRILDLRSGSIPVPGPSLWAKLMALAFHKRACYQHENEWRAVVYQDPRPEIHGIDVEFDPQALIAGVYVGPRAEPYLLHVVEAIAEKFGLAVPVERSSLLSPPRRKRTEVQITNRLPQVDRVI